MTPTEQSTIELIEAEKAKTALALAQAQTRLIEGMSLYFGSSSSELVNEDPVSDDGEPWDEVGAGTVSSKDGRRPTSEQDLARARTICRRLLAENGFAIGAMEARIAYIVGTGLKWKATPREDEDVPEEKTKELNAAIREFSKANDLPAVEEECVVRFDRDGEAILVTFPVPGEPLAVRFKEPEDIRPPSDQTDENKDLFGVKTDPLDVRTVLGYWIAESPDGEPQFLDTDHPGGLPQVIHGKANVDMNSRRGWPTFYAARRNFSRGNKLLRNMSFVAAIQAAIAMYRKHDTATSSQAETFLDANNDLLVVDQTSGRSTRHTRILPGTVFDVGPGTTYEAPISSVKAADNVGILQADLREIAAQLQMPEFMLTADTQSGNLASLLVAEGPSTKAFERLQVKRGNYIKRVVEAALLHKFPKELVEAHDLVPDFPTVISRNRLQESQRFDIERRNKVISVKTWRGIAGYDHDIEEANLEEERKKAEENTPPALMGQPAPGQPPDPEKGETPGPGPNPDPRSDDEEVGVPKNV